MKKYISLFIILSLFITTDAALASVDEVRNLYEKRLLENLPDTKGYLLNDIYTFIDQGVDDNTQKLGRGERAAVVFSYKKAFEKLPSTTEELDDIYLIANGRWPGQRNTQAELRGKKNFQLIYRRVPNMANDYDNAAVTILTYGLKQRAENRSLSSERTAISIFRKIFNQSPHSTEEWNMIQTIAYSGASRKNDTDGDGLSDEDEKFFGTDMYRSDTDDDGYSDGMEILYGYSPIGK